MSNYPSFKSNDPSTYNLDNYNTSMPSLLGDSYSNYTPNYPSFNAETMGTYSNTPALATNSLGNMSNSLSTSNTGVLGSSNSWFGGDGGISQDWGSGAGAGGFNLDKMGSGASWVNALSKLGSLYLGKKQLGLGKDMFSHQKTMDMANYGNSVQAYNDQKEARYRGLSRNFTEADKMKNTLVG